MKKTIMLLLICLAVPLVISAMDSDNDGIPDKDDEKPYDFDNDGLPDLWEKKNKLRYDIDDSRHDPDKDGLNNLIEYQIGTDPHVADNVKNLKVEKKFTKDMPAEYTDPKIRFLNKLVPYIIALIIALVLFLLRRKIKALFIKIFHRKKPIIEKRPAKPPKEEFQKVEYPKVESPKVKSYIPVAYQSIKAKLKAYQESLFKKKEDQEAIDKLKEIG